MSVFDFVDIKFSTRHNKLIYVVHTEYKYVCPRYHKEVTCPVGMSSDGATGACDIDSFAWLVHDALCYTGKFDDGTLCYNWQASQICSDILKRDGFWVRAQTWKYATFTFGGGAARRNGLLKGKCNE